MDRRRFLAFISAAAAGIALEQAIPLGRVWSFPSKIVAPTPGDILAFNSVNRVNLQVGDLIEIGGVQGLWRISDAYPNGNFSLKQAIPIRGIIPPRI